MEEEVGDAEEENLGEENVGGAHAAATWGQGLVLRLCVLLLRTLGFGMEQMLNHLDRSF